MSNIDDEIRKSDRAFRIIAAAFAVFAILSAVIVYIALSGIDNDIRSQGGLGHSIGNFIHDVKSSATGEHHG